MEQNVPLAEAVQAAHNALGIAIAVLLAIHIGAAVFHQAIRRDGILLRMV
jgi:cytochrome b561